MTGLIAAAGFILTALLLPFFAYLGLVALAAILGRRRPVAEIPPPSPLLAIVVPAHDEEAGIASTVASCLASEYPPDRFRVHVIADNCGDATAARAREAGAVVFERSDPDRRSKGYALETYFESTAAPWAGAGYDAAIIIDADSTIDPGLLRACAVALASGCDWAQAYYTVRNPDASWRTRLMTYAFALFNGVLPMGQDRLGLGVGLKGNGMMFSARGLARFPWKAYGLVEDAEFALMLKAAGERVRFLDDARVYGEMVSTGDRAVGQRRRWEAGRRALRGRFFAPLARSPRLTLGRKTFYLVDLCMPSLLSMAAGLGLSSLIHPLAWFWPELSRASAMLAPWHAAMGISLVMYATAPFRALGLPLNYLKILVYLPWYAVWKVARVGRRPPGGWERTRREPSAAPGGSVPS
ncbi:MAG: glycosyltransferase family 2 protein [Isosphaeraceae bacterium]